MMEHQINEDRRRCSRLDSIQKLRHRAVQFISGLFACVILCAKSATAMPATTFTAPSVRPNITAWSPAVVLPGNDSTTPVVEPTLPLLFPDKPAVNFTRNTATKDDASSKYCMFVYGTLKYGEPNHYVMKDGIGNGTARYVGQATTVERYPLILNSQYNIPTILYRPRAGQHIRGELYLVNDKFRAELDEFEEHPQVYQRYPIRVERALTSNDQQQKPVVESAVLNLVPLRCYAYLLFDYATQLLDKPTYGNYLNRLLPHKLQYVVDEDIGADPEAMDQIKEATADAPAVAPAA